MEKELMKNGNRVFIDGCDRYGNPQHGSKIVQSGKIAIMCCDCFNILEYINVDCCVDYPYYATPKIDNIMKLYKCGGYCTNCAHKENGYNHNYFHNVILLDPNIAEAISILNKKGYFTLKSSEGNIYRKPYIHFMCDYDEFEFVAVPKYWKFSIYDNCCIMNVEHHEDIPKEEYLDSLYEWVNKLPKRIL